MAAVRGPDELSWNQGAIDAIAELGASAPPALKYTAAKVLAENAAWEFVEKNRAEIGFDVTTICPAGVSSKFSDSLWNVLLRWMP